MLAYLFNYGFKQFRKLNANKLGPSVWSSVLMAVAGMGDALLYVYLPVSGAALGMSLFTIGFLLSINKFVRVFTNRWVACLTKDLGIKNVLLIGSVLAGITTFMYGLSPVIWLWVISRIIWGLSYSALRFSTFQYGGISANTGSALGIGRSIQESGPILAYWIGPLMINNSGAESTFISWSIILALLLPVFIYLPDFKPSEQKIKSFTLQKPDAINYWIFISSFAIEGLLIVGMSRLIDFNLSDPGQLMSISALYISFRRLMNIIISPISGWLSDVFGFELLFQISCILIIAGLTIIASGYSKSGVLVTFIGSAINMTLMPIIAIHCSPVDKNFDVLTRMSTSRDLGSAVGSLIALSVFDLLYTTIPFAVLGIILMFVWYKIPKFDYSYEKHY